ncbi:hypothetical protein QTP70_012099 [Hemibagrus guttatus]|uniref:ribonuclease H n=1 Tax=Hemibagrus guttatus TaxID=175788 RepID=A0AAE0UQP1_9TELE|nr:hypothetical protein QTP70_012099 [Hemibagrus guttatus]KAK3538658.1 hypothetical protein QTP86_011337 [Hemibagrus guttatus]
MSKAKQKAYDELSTRLDTREGEKDLYRLSRQRDRDGKDVQQVRVIKDRDGRVLTSEESVQRRWKEYFEELMNEENEREKRVKGVNSVEQKVDKIRKDEVRKALKRMKSGKAVGPDDIPVEVWKCLGEAAVEFLTSLFNRVLESERMPEEWRRSVLVPIFKNKGDVQSCSNYRGIKLMSHTMKLWERVVEARLRKVVEICEQQYGFMPRKSTTDAIFALRILMEKYRDGQRELHCVFVDLEKTYDRVPREELWYCMRKSGVAEKYVRVVQDMYERSRTVVRCAEGQTEEFKVEVGLHQGSTLSSFLFAIVMDQLSEEVRQESPWTKMFADDIVICSESMEQVEENLKRWRFALERRGMKVSRSKTEYMCVNEREGSGTVRLQGEEVKKVQEFKYLGSTVQSNGEYGKEVKKRVQAGWNGWRKVLGVLCDRKISARIKGKVYRTVVRPAMLYGLETVSLRKRQESELEVAELKMLSFSLGVTRLDRIRNEYIRGTAHVGRLGDKVREARLRWFGHVQRRESEDSFELHSVDLELEAVEKQIRDLQVKQAQLRQRKAALESSQTDAHLSQVNSRRETITPTTSTPCASLPRPSARTRPTQVSFTPAPGYYAAWMQQQQKTRAKPRARTSPPPPPPIFEISTQNRFAPLHETACNAVIIGDSIVRHVCATAAKGKVHTRCLPGARVLDVSAQVPTILKKNIGAVVLHAGTNDIGLRQTEILKKDFRSLVEKVRTTSPTTRIIVSGPLPTFQ